MPKVANLSGAVGQLPPMELPSRKRGQPWGLAKRRLNIYPERDGQRAAERFARAILTSYRAFQKREAARPTGDGKIIGTSGRRLKDYAGSGYSAHAPKVPTLPLPASKRHRHSSWCLDGPKTIDGSDGWYACSKLGWIGQKYQLHAHYTKRGRKYLVAHLPGSPCPWTPERIENSEAVLHAGCDRADTRHSGHHALDGGWCIGNAHLPEPEAA